MDERIHSILLAAETTELDRIASGASGLAGASCEGLPAFEELITTRADKRTLGIIKATGRARPADGTGSVPWTAVAKVIDLGEDILGEVGWTRPEIEEIVYEEGYFAGDGLGFRPAHCYAVTRPTQEVKVFWLEDLTGAMQAPFGVEHLATMARHLGEWSGSHQTVPVLKFPLVRDLYAMRWATPALHARYDRLLALDPQALRAVFRDVPRQALITLRGLLTAQNERAKALPHGLAFGDCQVGNLFHRADETIAVDWASLSVDPIGADAGAMIGSMLGRAGLLEVARNERALFDCYMEGLAAAGWRGSRDDIWRGFFCQYGHYLATTLGLMPVVFAYDEWPRAEVERRMRARWEDIPALIAPVIALYPAYIEELEQLAAR